MPTRIPHSLKPVVRLFQHPLVILAVVTLLTYGVFIPLLRFYWDDMAIHWIADVYGSTGLARYFSTNRPVWGLFYRLNTSLLGHLPVLWQIFGLFWRWVAASGIYLLLQQLWQGKKEPALWAALLFVVYPGFSQQPIAMVYGHFFLVLSCFLFSLTMMFIAYKTKKRPVIFHLAALLLSAVNLFSMEYFFMLELIRPILIWFNANEENQPRNQRIKHVFQRWLPYAVLWLIAGFWRTVIFPHQTENYQPQLITKLISQPLSGLGELLLLIIKDSYTTIIFAWSNLFHMPNPAAFGQRAWLLLIFFSLMVLAFLFIIFFLASPPKKAAGQKQNRWAFSGLITGLISILLAGIPFWLTGLPINLVFPYDRFTIPFMLAFCLVWISIAYLLPVSRRVRQGVLILLITFSSAHQLQTGIKFQRDWELQSRFFWQFLWRAPSLKPGTVLYAHELPLTYFSDNSLTAALNWIYDNNEGADHFSDTIPYLIYYPSIRIESTLEKLKPDQSINRDLLVGNFSGNSSQSLSLFYEPPACLRILDPQVESDNWMVPLSVREVIPLTSLNQILTLPQNNPPAFLYQPEPEHNWCYFFEKADLARQEMNWNEVRRLGDIAFSLDDKPNDPAERMPFIEGYAHLENWQNAIDLTQQSAQISPLMHPVLCQLWRRIDQETLPSREHSQAVQMIENLLECSSP